MADPAQLEGCRDLVIELPSGLRLDATLWVPPTDPDHQCNKLAIGLHPWSWLGGRKDDPTLDLLVAPLLEANYHLVQYNSRGVGKSSGWPSLTGFSEAEDLEAVVSWLLERITNVRTLVIVGYSHGALIASLFPVLPSVKTSHLLISYPLGPRPWLTLFNSSSYTRTLNGLLQHPESNVLVVHGNQDQFTSQASYKEWAAGLRGNIEVVEVDNATHFWHARSGQQLAAAVQNWLP